MRFRPDHLQRGGRTAERAAALRPQRNLRRRLRHDAARTTAPNENGGGGVRIAASLLVEMWGLEPQTPYMRSKLSTRRISRMPQNLCIIVRLCTPK